MYFLGQESKKFQFVKFLVLLMSNHNIRPVGIITLFYLHSVILLRGDVREWMKIELKMLLILHLLVNT